MIYVYNSHEGFYYISDEELSDDRLYCEVCNDYDLLEGVFESFQEFKEYKINNALLELSNLMSEFEVEDSIITYKKDSLMVYEDITSKPKLNKELIK